MAVFVVNTTIPAGDRHIWFPFDCALGTVDDFTRALKVDGFVMGDRLFLVTVEGEPGCKSVRSRESVAIFPAGLKMVETYSRGRIVEWEN